MSAAEVASGTKSNETLPILIELPESIVGRRVRVRPYRVGDGESLFEAVDESREHVFPWLPWGDGHRDPADSEAFVRRSLAAWISRTDLALSIWNVETGKYLGGTGLHRIDWRVPSFEIGYWLRKSAEGHGYMTETVKLLCRLAFEDLKANRVYIQCAAQNHRSAAVPPRAGFLLEGTFRSSHRNAANELCDMLVFGMNTDDYRVSQYIASPE